MDATPASHATDIDELGRLVDQARSVALAYRRLTGRPLGVTGEVGEYEAIRHLGLQLAPVRAAGFDAVDAEGRRYQVKARCLPMGASKAQRLGSIKIESPWDAVLLVLMGEDLLATEIWEADRMDVVAALKAPGSKARNERGALAVSKFKSIGRLVWSAGGEG
jgi:hypothetical protein